LFFTKVLDTFEEVEDGSSVEEELVNRDYWNKKARWTAETAERLLTLVKNELGDPQLSYVKAYVAITVGRNNFFWLHKRSENKSLLGFRMALHLIDETQRVLDEAKLSFNRKPKSITMTIDQATIDANPETFRRLAALVRKTWDKEI
jgi:hypothetical protein